MNHQPHTSNEYESELRALKERLLAMGGRCEELIRLAMLALENQDATLALKVEDTDREINRDELAIDDMAVRVLALRQPMGKDLRFLLMALKVVTDLERIGDEAVNIAERVGELSANANRLPETHALLPRMAALAADMLHEALDAFVEEDSDRAKAVLVRDDEVDNFYGQVLRETVEFMKTHPQDIAPAMGVCSCAKYLERIADHATNISEMVVFMVRGVDVRHRGNR